MRPKIVILALLVGAAGLFGILLLKHRTTPVRPEMVVAPAEIKSNTPVAPVINPPPVAVKPAMAVTPPKPAPPTVVDADAAEEEHEAYVQARVDKLQALESNDDAESLNAILSELTNTDKEVRAQAVESATQFGDRSAIPVLNDLAARTQDPEEKKELQEAAEFLAMPTLIEAENEVRQSKGLPPK